MKKLCAALLLLLGVAATASLAFAVDDGLGSSIEGAKVSTHKLQLTSHAAKLRSSALVGDTTYVGYTPGKFDAAKNWWSIGAGNSPAGSNVPAFHRPPAQGGMWDWEPTGGVYLHGDTLQGWWPDHGLYTGGGGQTREDWNRPWWAVEAGNNANYAPKNSTGQTYGVVGVWHRDDFGAATPRLGYTIAVPDSAKPAWAPIGGTYSAWMGLRAHNDVRFSDPLTGNAFTEDVIAYPNNSSATATGSDNDFPGYGSQMDQMLYRDIDMTGFTGKDLEVAYTFSTRLSTGFGTAAASRVGWFDKDPLQLTGYGPANLAPGNFISSTQAGLNAPRDSFTVYVGAPVGNSTYLGSDGNTHNIFDPQRRWFSEVIQCNVPANYKEIGAYAGSADLVAVAGAQAITIPNATLAPMLSAGSGKVRLVFRVHTNRGFDDQGTSYSSQRCGAAMVDNVTYAFKTGIVVNATSPVGWGDFEAASSINNAVAIDPANAWKSTGKPPSIITHSHPLATLLYEDLCGQPGDLSRTCNMIGTVISIGDHENSEAAGGPVDGGIDRERLDNCWSPTIQFKSDEGSWPNPIGLKDPGLGGQGDPEAMEDYYVDMELYSGTLLGPSSGNFWRHAIASFPAKDRNGNRVWGNPRYTGYIVSAADVSCFRSMLDNSIWSLSMLKWDNTASESPYFPDSVRIAFTKMQYCFRYYISVGCSPTDGAYYDNVSLTIVDGVPAPLGVDPWNLFMDTFPANEKPGLPEYGAKFDTCTALVRSGLNRAPSTGLTRNDVPGDSSYVYTSPGPGRTRVDLVFRVLPGPGNYVNIGRPDIANTLTKDPANIARPPVVLGDLTNFWTSYIANNGAYGTPGGHVGGVWNPNVWNSARMDTLEASGLFAYQGKAVLGGPGDESIYQTSLHEFELGIAPTVGDPWWSAGGSGLRAGLGLARNRCFVASATAATSDIDCVHAPPATGAGYDLSYISPTGGAYPATGYDGNATTVEGTKIIPDGLLCPGASVQYFFRKEDSSNMGVAEGLMPDTTIVFPQVQEGSWDGHRWQYFAVLPDRWKSASYVHPVYRLNGLGEACMLVVDNNDRRQDEMGWVGIADTIGATGSTKYGAHNGWHATNNVDPDDPIARVYVNGGSPGTTWDFYNFKASESTADGSGSIGNRLAYSDPVGNPVLAAKHSRLGPTQEMMRVFYKVMYQFSGDLNSAVLGPFSNRTSDDCGLIKSWVQEGQTNPLNPPDRGYWASGDGFVESNEGEGPASVQADLDGTVLGVSLRNNSYALESGNTETTPDLIPAAYLVAPAAADIWGVQNRCTWTNDVLDRTAGLFSMTDDAVAYEPAGAGPFPLLASVHKNWDATSPWIGMVDGYDLLHGRSRFDYDTKGRMRYNNDVLTNVFGKICTIYGTPSIPLDVPTFNDGTQFVNFMNLRNTPLVKGQAVINFGLSKKDFVEVKVFDVGGRLVRTLAAREFEPVVGGHKLLWDGADNSGSQVARGVYFTQVKFRNSNFNAARKLIVLK